MPLIVVTLEVSQAERSSVVSEVQPLNISDASVRLETSQPERSSVVSEEQWLNM